MWPKGSTDHFVDEKKDCHFDIISCITKDGCGCSEDEVEVITIMITLTMLSSDNAQGCNLSLAINPAWSPTASKGLFGALKGTLTIVSGNSGM